jgi:hypothetical protein
MGNMILRQIHLLSIENSLLKKRMFRYIYSYRQLYRYTAMSPYHYTATYFQQYTYFKGEYRMP